MEKAVQIKLSREEVELILMRRLREDGCIDNNAELSTLHLYGETTPNGDFSGILLTVGENCRIDEDRP